MDPRDLLDRERYPIDDLEHPSTEALIREARRTLDDVGVAEFAGFVRPDAVAAMVAESERLAHGSHHQDIMGTPYLELPDPGWPEDHPRMTMGRSALTALPYDRFDRHSQIRALYEWDPLLDFVAAALGVDHLYRYDDALGALNVAAMADGDELAWHFDHTDFVVSIALQPSEAGGDFECVPKLRHADDECYDEVADVLAGRASHRTTTLPMTAGTLVLFAGRTSLHRVTPIRGRRSRYVALLGYDTRPGTCSSEIFGSSDTAVPNHSRPDPRQGAPVHDLDGKVVAITGGASGIGLALAEAFAAEGMLLALADVEQGPLAETVAAFEARGVPVIGVDCDVADAEQVRRFASATFERFGTVDIVVNNAGVGGGNGPAWQISEAGWDWTVSVNLMGVVHGIQAFVPRLVEQRSGHVINTASLAGLSGAPMMAPYVATKHAVVGLSESLHLDFAMAGLDIGVSVLCPAFIRTRIAESGRNWPDRLGTSPLPAADSPSAAFIKGLVDAGIEPSDYAATVLDAVRTNRFFVLSDPAHAAAIQHRHDAAATGGFPSAPRL